MSSKNIIFDKNSTSDTLFFEVVSEGGDCVYDTWYDVKSRWICTCPDYYFRKRFCKHMKVCAELVGIDDVTVYVDVKDDWGSSVVSSFFIRSILERWFGG